MRFFGLYQYLGPAVLFPLAYVSWLRRLHGDHRLVWLVLSVPVVFGYVIPGVGTNRLRLWEIHTRLRVGRFRPHHGFVFGSATAMLTLAALGPPGPESGPVALARSALVVGSVLGFWNWIYDAAAIRAGFITVYSRLHAQGAGPDAIAADYAPVLFGIFGACYGGAIALAPRLCDATASWTRFWILLAASHAAALTLPVLGFVAWSMWRHGESGLRSYADSGPVGGSSMLEKRATR